MTDRKLVIMQTAAMGRTGNNSQRRTLVVLHPPQDRWDALFVHQRAIALLPAIRRVVATTPIDAAVAPRRTRTAGRRLVGMLTEDGTLCIGIQPDYQRQGF